MRDQLAVLVEVKAPLPRLHQLQRCALGQDELGARRNPERPGELVRIVAIEKQEVAAQRHAVERVHPGPAGMDELALGAPDIGLERDRRIKAPAASRARPDEARDRLGPVDPRRRAPLQLLVEPLRSEEHTSELQSLMRISYAVFCLKKQNTIYN